jgi:rubredoxin
MASKECPLCGELMRFERRERTHHVPGSPQTKTAIEQEWVCPECDYFEEAGTDDTEDG